MTVPTAVIPVSVVVMTKNEEENLPKCLRSLRRFDDVFVVDSGSVDRTREVAADAGASVVEFKWNGRYPKKKQWCLENLAFRYPWVLYVDADEEVTPALAEEVAERVAGMPRHAGFFVGFDYVFLGQRLRRGLRIYKLVLFERRNGHFADENDLDVENMWEVEGHYQPVISGSVGRLRHRMVHDDRASLYQYFARHNRYSDWEAAVGARLHRAAETQLERRHILKNLFARMPFRSLGIFLYSYLLAGGVLDGKAGFHYAVSRSFYYWQIGLKRRELGRRSLSG
jgi:glycosyltransferase involved in cell wall biosynthesis